MQKEEWVCYYTAFHHRGHYASSPGTHVHAGAYTDTDKINYRPSEAYSDSQNLDES